MHNAAMQFLEKIGILFLNLDVCKILEKPSCKVNFSDPKVK